MTIDSNLDLLSALTAKEALDKSGNIPPIAIALLLRAARELSELTPPNRRDKILRLWDITRNNLKDRWEGLAPPIEE